MAKVRGSVDHLGRPVIRIEHRDISILAVIDTGFNGELMVPAATALSLGVAFSMEVTTVELGNGARASVRDGEATINWLDDTRRVRVFVSESWLPTGDAPQGLLGTGLLTPHLLLIDFERKTVEIETQD
jgi:predicted aspartyl protease